MINRVYIAAPWPIRDQAKLLRNELHAAGIVVNSRWLDETVDAPEDNAEDDLADIFAAEAVVLLNPVLWKNEGTGGRHVEFGVALALNKRVFILGERSNVFHMLRRVVRAETVMQLIMSLKIAEPTQIFMTQRIERSINDVSR